MSKKIIGIVTLVKGDEVPDNADFIEMTELLNGRERVTGYMYVIYEEGE